MTESTADVELPKFKTLGNYSWPVMPADESFRKFRDRFVTWMKRGEDDPFITDEVLSWAPSGKLDELVSPPACGPVMRELAATFKAWQNDSSPSNWLQLAVMPPCEKNDIVRSWATLQGHRVIEPPDRGLIVDGKFAADMIDTNHEGVLVIPRLERWFIRHRNGLDFARALVDRLTSLQQHCVVGCNSWAWAFLSKAVGVDLAFPTGVTFQAFDALRLRHWFDELAENPDDLCFRYVDDGEDVFATNRSGSSNSDYFDLLSAKSLGIPWVAWHLWRRSLRFGPESGDQIAQKFPDEDTVWVSPLQTFRLPGDRNDVALLTLHSILIHGSLSGDELSKVMPSIDTSNVLVSLLAAKFIERDGDQFYCTAAAYPTLRGQLAGAGFPMDRL